MSITNIPFPRLPFRQYGMIAFAIGFTISFILMVFQPFGTANFQHPQKNLILAGYGITVFIALIIYYSLSIKVIHKNKQDRWTIVMEALDLFVALILGLLSSYLYFIFIFNIGFRWNNMFSFLFNASTVALLPVLGSFGYLYIKWKDVVQSSIQTSTENPKQVNLKIILGNSKTDRVEATSDEILMAQAQSNYVMLYVQKEEKIQRHILRSTLKQIKEQLDDTIFIQAHRSYIINRSKISGVLGNKSKPHIKLEGFDKNIPISRKIYDSLKTSDN